MSGRNGEPGARQPDMSPAERKVWLASHAAPEQYMLVTSDEMHVMMDGVRQNRELIDALQKTFRRCEKITGDYWKTEPDLPNGVAAAVFDAQKYKKISALLLPQLRRMVKRIEAVRYIVAPHVGEATNQDVFGLEKEIKEALDLLETQAALRRDRKSTT